MTTKKLEKSEWLAYFNSIAKNLKTIDVAIEVSGLSIGNQIEVEWLPLIGLTYDPKDNNFDVATSKINHRICNVKQICVEQNITGLQSMEIIDGNGNHQIIRLKQPLILSETEPC